MVGFIVSVLVVAVFNVTLASYLLFSLWRTLDK
jgi:hypothetical protein